jgi:hypothetical protein
LSDLWPINISPAHTLSKIGLNFSFSINLFIYSSITIIIFLLLMILINNLFKDNSPIEKDKHMILIVLIILIFSYSIYSHAPIYYLFFSPVFLYFIEYNFRENINNRILFVLRLNLVFMTFYFPLFRSVSELKRFDDSIHIFLTYNSYILLLLNLSLVYIITSSLFQNRSFKSYPL